MQGSFQKHEESAKSTNKAEALPKVEQLSLSSLANCKPEPDCV